MENFGGKLYTFFDTKYKGRLNLWFFELSSLPLQVYYLNIFEINLFKDQNHKTPGVKWP